MDEKPKVKPAPEHKALVTDATQMQHPDTHVTWDEETIALHDLDRGTRMKIDEPDTPYHYYTEGDAVSPARSLSGKEGQPPIEWDELRSKLQDVKDNKKSESDSEDESSSGLNFAARDEEGKKIEKDPKFAEKRKQHYNEFERVRAWKMQHAAEEEDEEEEKPAAN